LTQILLTAAAMVAFAANSLLCRLALDHGHIDAASFSLIRVLAGAVTLAVLVAPQFLGKTSQGSAVSTPVQLAKSYVSLNSAIALAVYLVFFSFAYVSLGTATGALILFGAVQFTMIAAALMTGERFTAAAIGGLVISAAGVIYLLLPGVTAPDLWGTGLMTAAGIGWGMYSLIGRGAGDPLLSTAVNFLLATPLVGVTSFAAWWLGENPHYTTTGLGLALASGALASGVGYAIWYSALRGLSAGRAAIIQLSVPVIAAFGAALFLSEPITQRILLATIVVLGGITLVLRARTKSVTETPTSPDNANPKTRCRDALLLLRPLHQPAVDDRSPIEK